MNRKVTVGKCEHFDDILLVNFLFFVSILFVNLVINRYNKRTYRCNLVITAIRTLTASNERKLHACTLLIH